MKINKCKNNKKKIEKEIQETKLHAIPRFPAGSFAVHIIIIILLLIKNTYYSQAGPRIATLV